MDEKERLKDIRKKLRSGELKNYKGRVVSKERYEKLNSLYGKDSNFYPVDKQIVENTSTEQLKNFFSKKLDNVLTFINKEWTTYWLSEQTGIERTCIMKMINGSILPSIQNLLRLLIFFDNKIKHFNFYYLFSPMVNSIEKEDCDINLPIEDYFNYEWYNRL